MNILIHDLNDRIDDVVIAGGGLAGLLVAMRLVHSHADLKIRLLEKNPLLGGRLGACNLNAAHMRNQYGLQSVSSQLADFISKTFLLDSEWVNEFDELDFLPMNLGLYTANKLWQSPDSSLFNKKMAAKIGGIAVAKSWEETLSAFAMIKEDDGRLGKAVHKAWSQTKKSGPGLVMELLSGIIGIPDFWSAPIELVAARIEQFAAGFVQPDWGKVFTQALDILEKSEQFSYMTDCRILGSRYGDGLWNLETEQGAVQCRSLIVCHNPWAAMEWLDVERAPAEIIAFDSKTQPISLVSLWSERTDASEDFSKQMILVPAERASLFIDKTQMCAQAAIPFEMSMDAPNVVKTVKRLKRSKKKFVQNFPDLKVTDKEQIALLSVAWSQSGQAMDRRFIRTMQADRINKPGLLFCGNAYGDTYNGDLNLIRSILLACQTLQEQKEDVSFEQSSFMSEPEATAAGQLGA